MLQEIQRHSLGRQDRASRTAQLDNCLTPNNRKAVTPNNSNSYARIDPSKNFRGGLGSSDDCRLTGNDLPGNLGAGGDEYFGRDITATDVLSQRNGYGIKSWRRHHTRSGFGF